MKRVLSAFLSVIMIASAFFCVDLSAYAVDNDNYTIYQADYYSKNFNFETTSFSQIYYDELRNDDFFITAVNAWETIHIATSPSYSLESGMITKTDYYKTVLFDLFAQSDSNDGLDDLLNIATNQQLSYAVSVSKVIMSAESVTAETLNTVSPEQAINLIFGSKYCNIVNGVSIATQIAAWCKDAKEAVDTFSKYQAIYDLKNGTKELLNEIAGDSSNPYELRQAASECANYFENGYNEVLNQIIGGVQSIGDLTMEIITDTALDWAWNLIVASIPGGKAVMLAAKGARALTNYLFSTDKEVEAYYKLEAQVAMENAIKQSVNNIGASANITSNPDDAAIYMNAVDAFIKVIILGFDYSIDLLTVCGNSNFNTSSDALFGNYSQCMNLVNQINDFRENKISYFINFENQCLTGYKNKYYPDYDSVLNGVAYQKIPVESISLSLKNKLSAGISGFIDDYIKVEYSPSGYTEITMPGWSSSDENIIKFTPDYTGFCGGSFEAVSNGECTITCSLSSGVSQSITVNVGEKQEDQDHDYYSDFKYSVNSDGKTATITDYIGSAKVLTIPSVLDGYTVTIIGYSAFRDCNALKKITLPNSITTIESYAFYGCSQLTNINIPQSITKIKSYTFYNCANLSTIILHEGITSISNYAFFGCSSLEEIDLPNTIVSIGNASFANCSRLKTVSFPISTSLVTNSYNIESFEGCTNVNSLYLKLGNGTWKINSYNTLLYIFPDSYMKINCVVFSDEISSIPDCFLQNCESLENVILPSSLETICDSTFLNCKNLESIQIPNKVTYIGASAFSHCTSLTEINLPNGLKHIENYAFQSCTSLITVVIPDSVEKIGTFVFYSCESLKYLTLPCLDLNSDSFYGCCNIERIVYSKGSAKMPDYENYYDSPHYNIASSLKEVVLCDGIENIGNYAFTYCSNLENCDIPDSVKIIGDNAFAGCSSLNVELPTGIISIGKDALENTEFYLNEENWTNGLLYLDEYLISAKSNISGTVNVKDGTTLISDGAFQNYCYYFDHINLPESLLYIGKSAFSMCYGLEDICIPQNILLIGDDAFEDCRSLVAIYVDDDNPRYTDENGVLFNKNKTVIIKYPVMGSTNYIIPNTVTEIYYCAFEWCTNLKSIEIPSSVRKIGDYAFFRCYELSIIELPETIQYLGKEAFAHCSNLESVNIPSEIQNIMPATFKDCSRLSIIKIPEGIVTIGASAFSDCSELTTVFIPSSVTLIDENAFYNCTELKILSLSKNIEKFDSYAFYNAKSIQHVIFDGTKEEWELLPTKWYATSFDNAIFHFSETVANIFEEKIVNSAASAKGYYIIYHCSICDLDLEAEYMINENELNFDYSITSSKDAITGEITTFANIKGYLGDDENVTIPSYIRGNPVFYIEENAFSNNKNIKNVTISENVKQIKEGAFQNCTNLNSITIPNSVISIGENAFYACKNIEKVNITNMENWCNIKFFDSNSNPLCYGGDLYLNNVIVNDLVIPNSVTNINACAFCGCGSLTEIIIPDSVTSIGSYAFSNCDSLAEVTIPESVTSIGDSAFYNSYDLTDVYYFGSENEWNSIYIGSFNDAVLNATIHYNYVIHEHNYTTLVTPPTCTEDGYTTYTCNICGKIMISDYISATGHNYVATITPPTCTEDGYTTYTCTVCGDTMISDYISATGHSYSDGVCVNCGENESNKYDYCLLEDGTVEITGYTDSEAKLIIPSEIDGYTVTRIGDYAFYNCTSLTKIAIPNSVTSIGIYAFYYCTSLTEITIPNSITSMGAWVFADCTSLTDVILGNGVTSIGNSAFYNCTSLTEITIPCGVTNIDSSTFKNCTSLTEITIPESVTSIEHEAFSNCTSLTEITIPESVESIEYEVFSNCTSLTEITIPDSVASIEYRAFYNCNSLISIYVDNTNINYSSQDGILFNKDKTTLIQYPIGNTRTSYIIPDSVTNIYGSAFYNCTSLTEITIPDSVTIIDIDAFAYCTTLTDITIGNNVTSIGDNAFASCKSLRSVTIPDSVTSIGCDAFRNCTSLSEIKISNHVTSIDMDAFSYTAYYDDSSNWEGNVLYLSNYLLKAKPTLEGNYIIKDETTVVAGAAFLNCTSLAEITIPDSVTSIDRYAFSGCTSLTDVTIGNNVTSIGNDAFDYCTSLTDVYYGGTEQEWNGITYGWGNDYLLNATIHFETESTPAESAFEYIVLEDGTAQITDYTGSAAELVIPSEIDGYTVTSIRESALYDCASLTRVTIPSSITEIGYQAFGHCMNLTDINVEDGNEKHCSVDGVLFSKDKKTIVSYPAGKTQTEYSIPESVENISSYAFRDNAYLESITIPDGVTSIGTSAFESCTSLADISFPESVVSVGVDAVYNTAYFKDDSNWVDSVLYVDNVLIMALDSIRGKYEIRDGTKVIVGSAFDDCRGLTEVVIPDSVTTIVPAMFINCTGLKSVTIPESVTEIGKKAFDQCTSLTEIHYSGSETAWNKITVGDDNSALDSATIYFAKESLLEVEDGESGVTVSEDALEVLPGNTELVVEKVSETTTGVSYNISLQKDGEEIQPNGTVTVKIPVPETMDGNACKVYRQESDGSYTDMNAVYQDRYMIFTTDHFSRYILTTGDPSDMQVMLGDVDGDGEITDWDAIVLNRYLAGWEVEMNSAAADMDGDGELTDWDAIILDRYLAGWDIALNQ